MSNMDMALVDLFNHFQARYEQESRKQEHMSVAASLLQALDKYLKARDRAKAQSLAEGRAPGAWGAVQGAPGPGAGPGPRQGPGEFARSPRGSLYNHPARRTKCAPMKDAMHRTSDHPDDPPAQPTTTPPNQ